MKTIFDYKRIELVSTPSLIQEKLKLYGNEGWELIYYKERNIDTQQIAFVAVFKKAVIEYDEDDYEYVGP